MAFSRSISGDTRPRAHAGECPRGGSPGGGAQAPGSVRFPWSKAVCAAFSCLLCPVALWVAVRASMSGHIRPRQSNSANPTPTA